MYLYMFSGRYVGDTMICTNESLSDDIVFDYEE